MADSRLIKVITSQYKRFLRQPEDNIIIVMDDTNIMEWYAMIVLDTEIYKNGEFIFKLTLPIDYPHSPPSCVAMTKNPIFEQGGPLCINISEFHRKQYIASLGAVGFAKQLWNALLFFTFEDSINSPIFFLTNGSITCFTVLNVSSGIAEFIILRSIP